MTEQKPFSFDNPNSKRAIRMKVLRIIHAQLRPAAHASLRSLFGSRCVCVIVLVCGDVVRVQQQEREERRQRRAERQKQPETKAGKAGKAAARPKKGPPKRADSTAPVPAMTKVSPKSSFMRVCGASYEGVRCGDWAVRCVPCIG